MDPLPKISIPEGAFLVETTPNLATMVPGPVTRLLIELEYLKPERVQEPGLADGEEETRVAFLFGLTVHQPQPVTIEISEPKITITLHGNPAAAAQAA